MTSGTARSQQRHARPSRRPSKPVSLGERLQRITLPGWVALAACAVTLAITLQTLQGRSADYDEGVYWQSLRAMANGHALFGSVFSSQPPLFLLSIYPFFMLFGQSLSAARVGLLVFALVGIAGVYWLGRALGYRSVGAAACLLLALDPLFERGTHTLQAELPSVALQIWAVACAALAMRANGRRRDWLAVAAGAFLGGALMLKLFAVAAIVPVVLLLSLPLAKRWLDDNGKLRWLHWAEVWDGLRAIAPTLGYAAAGLVGMVILVLLPFLGQLGTVYDQAVAFHLAAARVDGNSLGKNARVLGQTLVGTPLFYIGALATVALIWRRMWAGLVMVAWALAALLVDARQQPLFPHHVILLSPALALAAAFGALVFWRALAAWGQERIGQAVAVVAVTLACGAGLTLNIVHNAALARPPDTRSIEMALTLQGVSAPTEVVLTDDQYIAAIANRDVPPQLVDTSGVRIASGYLTANELESLITRDRIHAILFASGRFDALPGFRVWVAAHYTEVTTFDQNGALYVLEPNTNPPV